jgi:hypothetical protein
MVNTSIAGTSSDGYRNVIGLPRLGGSSHQISKEKEFTGIIADNQVTNNRRTLLCQLA